MALEFSPHERSAALFVNGDIRGFATDRTSQGIRSFELIQNVLDQADIHAADVESVAVGLGPGSQAGVRIAIAIAKGWHLARGAKLLGVSSADAIARKINTPEGLVSDRPTRFHGVMNIVFDTQREQACAVRYKIGRGDPLAIGGFDLLTPEEERRRRESGEVFVKADIGPWRHGNETVILSDARVIGQIASQRSEPGSKTQLEPVYLRKVEFVKALPPRFVA